LKHASTKFWLCASTVLGTVLGTALGTALGMALLLAIFSPPACGQTTSQTPSQSKDTVPRVNEVTLAGLRPGRDSLGDALKHFKAKYSSPKGPDETETAEMKEWGDACTGHSLKVEVDSHGLIDAVTLSSLIPQDGKCVNRRIDALNMKDWETGHGLRIGDPRNRVTETYGEPDSSGPSMRDSKELEMLRYHFGWAGSDVPQDMIIYCARESGRVLEITLARPAR
jgi:hypothetical protein